MTGFDSKRKMARDKLVVTDIDGHVVRDARKPKKAQPVQEQVAWAIYDKRGGSKSLHWPEQHSPNGDANMFDAVPLYTAPSKRPWVNLAFAEICECENESLLKFARNIEAKLKEKNT